MRYNTTVILGGGTGGIVTARELRNRLNASDRIIIIEHEPIYTFGPSLLWLMAGTRTRSQVQKDIRVLRKRGIEILEAEVNSIETASATVHTSAGVLSYDQMVIALGATLAPERLPGFNEAAHNIFTLEGALSAGTDLRRGGVKRVAVVISSLPYKCPAAPYEAAFIADELLRKRGVRKGSEIRIYTPEPYPMPTAGPVIGEQISSLLAKRGIELYHSITVEKLDSRDNKIVLSNGAEWNPDIILGVPAHKAPDALAGSGLEAESGYVPVDKFTLSTSQPGVYAVGDITQIPIAGGKMVPKAGVFAEAEAKVVATRIARDLHCSNNEKLFTGKGACFLEIGSNKAGFANGNLYTEGEPSFVLHQPGTQWHLGKVAFEKYFLKRWLG